VYAIGDITGKKLLAHVASAQGEVAGLNACGKSSVMDYAAVPSCIYTFPEVASVGLKASEAPHAKSYKLPIKTLSKSHVDLDTDGFVKVVADAKNNKILGVHIIAAHASEMISVACLAVKKKMTAQELAELIFVHPSFGETIAEACRGIYAKPIHASVADQNHT
jgi:dihydrolipoamide dehydrogenase